MVGWQVAQECVRRAQFVANEAIDGVLDGVLILTAFPLQKPFPDEGINFRFV